MAQSPEYPDLRWMPPKSWTNANRTSVQLVVIHTTEGSSHAQSAEDGAAYDQRRTDGTSTHYFHDSDSTVHCVRTEDQAHTARAQGNRRGIQHELCGRAGWTSATWAGPYAQAMLKRAAKQAARDARKWSIPVRHLTIQQIQDGLKGFCSHWDITRAFPADNGTHTDPGPNFPWSQFLDLVRAELAPPPGNTDAEEEDDMPSPEDYANAVWAAKPWRSETPVSTADAVQQSAAADDALRAVANLTELIMTQSRIPASELAAALAPPLKAGMPLGASKEEIEEAVLNALRRGTGGEAPGV